MENDEGIKCLLDLIEWCKKNFNPENGGNLGKTITFLQSLQQEIQEIECLLPPQGAAPTSFNTHGTDLQRGQEIESSALQGDAFGSNPHVNEQEIESAAHQGGAAPTSFNVHGTNLQRGQEITQIRKQNTNFGSTLNQGINMEMNKKRKLRSDVWNHFIRYRHEDKEMKAQCQHCKKYFNGSSKSGTTHLRNHLKSCLKNQNIVADKMKELSVVDQELNHCNLARKVIKYGWDNIKDDIIEVYEEEKDKLHRYLAKLPGRFNVIIGKDTGYGVQFVKIWFIDDKWKLKTRLIHWKNYDSDGEPLNEDSLKRLIQDWNMDKRILSMIDHRVDPSKDLVPQLTNWLNERVSLPVIGNYKTCHKSLGGFEFSVKFVAMGSDIMSEVRELKDYYMTSSNKYKFDLAVKQVESMGKKVTSKYNDVSCLYNFKLLDWAMGYKEVFCELKRIDPDFTSSNFDWDDAASLHSYWVVFEDIKNDIWKLEIDIWEPEDDSELANDSKLANECFPMVYHFFLRMLRFKNTENQYFRLAALRCREVFDEHCNNIVTVIPVILDPRFKLDIVERFYNEVYDNEGDLHFKKIMDDVKNIYNKYATDVNNSSMVIANPNEAASSKSEFERYLTADKVPPLEGFDILEWWRKNSPTYPALAMMARDFLSIPIVDSPYVYFADDVTDIYYMDFDVGLKDVSACTKVWLNDHDCM
ncbi:zinc finger BED domain-containing protein RICESLEEPER 3-like [Mangifera indica]|uniref:zinc finger BED domain-containing protein RICESLEEPER 3-like n=1 Tax=Mangifera indica TaxID=29780 RepID=UPI001CFB8B0A|nr:zinc finger BED domain-containing protein RICESLEEPER 3-like [Mangifera indica]